MASGQLRTEELIGNEGFSGPASLVYHIHPPTQVKGVRPLQSPRVAGRARPDCCAIGTSGRPGCRTGPSPVFDRVPLLFNADVAIGLVRGAADDEAFYRNAQGDEIVFVTDGAGILESPLGTLPFREGDYLVIPRGILHRYRFERRPSTLLVIESARLRADAEAVPQRVRAAPRAQPVLRARHPAAGVGRPARRARRLPRSSSRRTTVLVEMVLAHHPFDVVGWDGYYYPWAFNIHDFEPRVGRFHLPPPVHQTFEGDGFVVCSFCPRPYDFERGRGAGAVQPLQRDVRRGALLRRAPSS